MQVMAWVMVTIRTENFGDEEYCKTLGGVSIKINEKQS